MRIKQYKLKKTQDVEAAMLEQETAADIAQWCGGRVFDGWALIPTLEAGLRVEFGAYVCRDQVTGEFFAMEASKFEEKYKQVGLRQDGIDFSNKRIGDSISRGEQ